MQNKYIEEVAGRYGILIIYLFGSQALRGKDYLSGKDVKPDTFSDLDVAVAFKTPPENVIKIYGVLYKEISDLNDRKGILVR